MGFGRYKAAGAEWKIATSKWKNCKPWWEIPTSCAKITFSLTGSLLYHPQVNFFNHGSLLYHSQVYFITHRSTLSLTGLLYHSQVNFFNHGSLLYHPQVYFFYHGSLLYQPQVSTLSTMGSLLTDEDNFCKGMWKSEKKTRVYQVPQVFASKTLENCN